MAKSNQTANEAQLKARRTSLGKKSVDELITIILRKDKSERSMNAKIQSLAKTMSESLEKATNYDKDVAVLEDRIHSLLEQIDCKTIEYNSNAKEIVRLKNLCNFRRKVIFGCFGIITILIVLLFVLG